ncbi:hypothetical protein [Bacillus sp. SJS]|uniref:hypothetical protein n=1 Tax=Bacillus sp. SJS TaxID=1423321 RepID=UPI0004DCB20F|nr:hypothetical protein [Bacillus sp. SJS]KZZ83476.1 hypothetical protein AS29_015850 [Bacillus sp. SJS]
MEEDSHFLIYGYSVIDTGLALFRGLKKFGWNAIVNGRKSRECGWKTDASSRKRQRIGWKKKFGWKASGNGRKSREFSRKTDASDTGKLTNRSEGPYHPVLNFLY